MGQVGRYRPDGTLDVLAWLKNSCSPLLSFLTARQKVRRFLIHRSSCHLMFSPQNWLNMPPDTPLGLLIQWLALTGLVCHATALAWACLRCCRRRQTCPFDPCTRVNAGRVWAWEAMHPGCLLRDYSECPRQRQSSQGGADQAAPARGLTTLVNRRNPSRRTSQG